MRKDDSALPEILQLGFQRFSWTVCWRHLKRVYDEQLLARTQFSATRPLSDFCLLLSLYANNSSRLTHECRQAGRKQLFSSPLWMGLRPWLTSFLVERVKINESFLVPRWNQDVRCSLLFFLTFSLKLSFVASRAWERIALAPICPGLLLQLEGVGVGIYDDSINATLDHRRDPRSNPNDSLYAN
jgi:hypothetical protein